MNTIDIRTGESVSIEKIVFADDAYNYINAIGNGESTIDLYCDADDPEYPSIGIRMVDIPALLKAIEKAKELGWIKEPVVKPFGKSKKK